MVRQKRGVERRKMICYVAIHKDSGRRYVGITKRGLKTRRSQHERDATNKRSDVLFHDALREYGEDAFTWKVVAEGEDEVIKLLETALIAAWGTARLGGFNSTGLYAEAPIRDLGYEKFAEEMDARVREMDMLNDLNSIICYLEEHYSRSTGLEDLRELGIRLLKRVNELNDV